MLQKCNVDNRATTAFNANVFAGQQASVATVANFGDQAQLRGVLDLYGTAIAGAISPPSLQKKHTSNRSHW
eukprot:g81894.t1